MAAGVESPLAKRLFGGSLCNFLLSGLYMIEFRWVGRQLHFRERGFQVDAAGSFCGVTEFGPWKIVEDRREIPPFIEAAKDVVSAFAQHGVGPEFPELQAAIEKMQAAFEGSVWSR